MEKIAKYVLLGEIEGKETFEVLASSDTLEDLEKQWDNIDILMQEREEMEDGFSKVSDIADEMIGEIDAPVFDQETEYLKQVTVLGIFETKEIMRKK